MPKDKNIRSHATHLSITCCLEGDPPIQMHRVQKMEEGAVCNVTRINMGAHNGTHLDANLHFIVDGTGVETLDLQTLIGPALVIDAGEAQEITARCRIHSTSRHNTLTH